MPYRIDLANPPHGAVERLIDLGAIDVDLAPEGLAAIMPDAVSVTNLAGILHSPEMRVSDAVARDDGSVWALRLRPVRVGVSDIFLTDSSAFGTGLHQTTALALESVESLVRAITPSGVLDVGTGSGILAIAGLKRGVRTAVGLDIDSNALRAARENARLNGVEASLRLIHGGPDAVRGIWPLVLANIRAAELMAMAPALVRRIASRGRLVLSGIPQAVAQDVSGTYTRMGLAQCDSRSRDGWTALIFRPTW